MSSCGRPWAIRCSRRRSRTSDPEQESKAADPLEISRYQVLQDRFRQVCPHPLHERAVRHPQSFCFNAPWIATCVFVRPACRALPKMFPFARFPRFGPGTPGTSPLHDRRVCFSTAPPPLVAPVAPCALQTGSGSGASGLLQSPTISPPRYAMTRLSRRTMAVGHPSLKKIAPKEIGRTSRLLPGSEYRSDTPSEFRFFVQHGPLTGQIVRQQTPGGKQWQKER